MDIGCCLFAGTDFLQISFSGLTVYALYCHFMDHVFLQVRGSSGPWADKCLGTPVLLPSI